MNPAAPADTIEHNEINALDKFVMAGALVAAILSAYSVTMMAPGSWRFFAAGAICAATSHAIPTPIDVVKVRADFTVRLVFFETLAKIPPGVSLFCP